MEDNRQNTCEEVKDCDVVFKPEDVNYPRCPLHKFEAILIPKDNQGWTKYSNHILKCNKCINIEKIDSTEFRLLDEVFEEYTQELGRISKQQVQNNFLGILNNWLKQLATLQDSIKKLTELIHGCIKLH